MLEEFAGIALGSVSLGEGTLPPNQHSPATTVCCEKKTKDDPNFEGESCSDK